MGKPEDLPEPFAELAKRVSLNEIDLLAGPTADPEAGEDEVHICTVQKLVDGELTTLYEGPVPPRRSQSAFPDRPI